MPTSTRVLVTGGSGLIGRAVVSLLEADGNDVAILDAAETERGTQGDVRDLETVVDAMRGCDIVVHLGGIAGPELAEPTLGYDVNAHGTFTVFQAAATLTVRKVVYASSINASGLPIGGEPALPRSFPYDEDEPTRLADWYSLSKAANEAAAGMFHTRYGLELTGLRFPLTRDLRHDNGIGFGAHVRRLVKEAPLRAAAEGWSYLDVHDAAVAVRHAIERPTPPAPGVLIAAPTTYLAVDTSEAIVSVAPDVPSTIVGRNVGLDLRRSSEWLGFQARSTLEVLAPNEIISAEEWEA